MAAPLVARKMLPLTFALGLLALPACAKADRAMESSASTPVAAAAPVAQAAAPALGGEVVSERKVIRNAELTVEARDVAAARERAIKLVEQAGGYVASSTESHSGQDDEWMNVQLTLMVPSGKLTAVLESLRGTGARVAHEHVGSQDVTAEFYDLEARLKAQRAVEAQFLAIAKEAHSVPDLLAVQRQLGEVRAEIERMEGRRNQINHQVSLSTVQFTLRREHEVASASIASTFKKAGGDAVSVGSALVHGSIRTVGVLAPVALFFGPIGYLAARLLRRLLRRTATA